jgi:hypothetical protein
MSIINYQDKHFNKKIVLEGLEESLADYGLIIGSCETRENGEGTPLVIRIKI